MALKVHDCIFGSFELPSYLDSLLTTPEFRRLSEVRLININSPSLSSLSETKRYSHTLGVLRLALANPMLGFSEEERKALFAAIIVGTLPRTHTHTLSLFLCNLGAGNGRNKHYLQ